MAGVNKVILIGNLGSDPEIRYLDGGSTVARFNIATTEAYTNRNGERVEQTEWHRVELWDNLAKIAEQYLRKGHQVYIEGKLRSETWQDKDGVQRTGVRVRGTGMTLLRNPTEGGDQPGPAYSAQPAAASQSQPAAPANRPAPAPSPAPAPAPRRQPEPVPFESNGGDDDLPF